jgi:Carboxypeptidase regulatory-like domain
MSKAISWLMLLALLAGLAAFAQAPTGIITGTITDESGAIIPNATISITNKDTSFARTVTANAEGLFSAPALVAGVYEVRTEVSGFKTTVREATVEIGSTTTVNLQMQLGGTKDIVNVEAATAAVNYESNTVQGVIERATIQELPLNGRSFMQLASLEPGVTVTAGTTAQFNTLFTVSVLGGGNRTVFTIDGGNISDNIDVGGGISSMNFSQEIIQEFQISSVNFDLSTPIAVGGAINIVTRSGTNEFHGGAYFFFRDHNMAAYPNLVRDPLHPNPFFARRNPGATLGGPIKKDKLFFFFNFEHTNQVQAIGINGTGAFAPLTNSYGSPYTQKEISAKFDYRLSAKHTLFVRYSHDGNEGFAQSLEFGDPSNWPHNKNWADQSIMGITSVITPALVNDFRFQYNYWNNHNTQAVPSDCSAPCVAGSLPNVFTVVGSNFPGVGPNFNAPQARNTRRYELVEGLSYQKGTHRMKFGGDLNPTTSKGLWGFCTPMCVGAFSPDYVRGALGPALTAALFPTLPTTVTNDAQFLNLPVLNIGASIFSGVGVGGVTTPGAYNYADNSHFNQFRAYFQDTWKIKSNFTVNYGVAWNAQTGFYGVGIPLPAYLSPIVGTGSNLQPTQNNVKEFSPAFGFAWSPGKSQKWVIRGGGGIYWDGTPGYYKLREASSLEPPGADRNTLAASAFTNIYPGLLNIGAGGIPIPVGASLPLGALTNMTIGQFVNLVNIELPGIQAQIAPVNPQRSGPITVSGIDLIKQGVEIYPHSFPLARSYQTNIGFQRELPWGMVLQVDYARRQGENVSLGEVDMNQYNLYQGSTTPHPVIPLCTPAQVYHAGIECSSGAITFWTDQGRAIYNGMLVKMQKRFSHHASFQASYALQRATTETVWNEVKWSQGYGQYLAHNNFNFAGTYEMKYGFQLSVNSSFISRAPVTANVSGLLLPGTDAAGSTEPLPGIPYGSLNAGTDKAGLIAAVQAFNTNYAGTLNSQGGKIGALQVPTNFQFGDPTFSQDFRLTKKFTFREKYSLNIVGEMFNAFNIANLGGYSFTLDPAGTATPQFGRATSRVGQSLGQGGPRAVQVAARFQF